MKLASRYAGLQTRLKGIDSDGCHFLFLCSVAERVNGRPIDMIDVVNITTEVGLIKDEYTVQDACQLLSVITGKSWTKEELTVKPESLTDHEYLEEVWFNPRTGFHHYRDPDTDTLENSVTVKEGHVEKYYVYRWS